MPCVKWNNWIELNWLAVRAQLPPPPRRHPTAREERGDHRLQEAGVSHPRRHRRGGQGPRHSPHQDSRQLWRRKVGLKVGPREVGPGKTERRFWAEFRLFSADFPPKMVPHPCFIYISGISAEFGQNSAYFPPKMIPHPCYIYISGVEFGQKNSSMVPHPPFFRPHFYRFRLFSAYVPAYVLLIFHLFST